jgi:hypothetical protein
VRFTFHACLVTLEAMKTLGLFVAAIALLASGLVTRQHAITYASTLEAQIVAADAAGQSTSSLVPAARTYVATHMGTSMSFELTHAYQQAEAAAQSAAQPQNNGNVYAQAQATCASIKIATQQAQCNENYLSTHLTQTSTPTIVTAPNEADYQYHFVAPRYTADATGYLWVFSVAAMLAAVWRLFWRK